MDPYNSSEINLDIQKKFLIEKINKIKGSASKGKFEEAMRFIKNLTTPWNKNEYAHCSIQYNLWNEVRQLWSMTQPDTVPGLNENPYEWDSDTGGVKKRKAKRRSSSRCRTRSRKKSKHGRR